MANGGHNPRPDPYTGATDLLGYFGVAAAQALIRLVGYADLIELYNEPNDTGGHPSNAGPWIDPPEYGDMAAFAAYWVWNCVSAGGSPPNPYARVAAGALSMGAGDHYNYQTYLPQFLQQMCNRLVSLNSSTAFTIYEEVRVSFHPYPAMDQTDVGLAVQRVQEKTNNVITLGTGRRYWATEVAASSRGPAQGGLGEAGQVGFASSVSMWMGSIPQIEGMLWWPFSDYDPRASNSLDPFSLTGVVRNDAGSTNKPAASWFAYNW